MRPLLDVRRAVSLSLIAVFLLSYPVSVIVQLRTGDMVTPIIILAGAFIPLLGVVTLRRLSAEGQFAVLLTHAGVAVALLALLMFFGAAG